MLFSLYLGIFPSSQGTFRSELRTINSELTTRTCPLLSLPGCCAAKQNGAHTIARPRPSHTRQFSLLSLSFPPLSSLPLFIRECLSWNIFIACVYLCAPVNGKAQVHLCRSVCACDGKKEDLWSPSVGFSPHCLPMAHCVLQCMLG